MPIDEILKKLTHTFDNSENSMGVMKFSEKEQQKNRLSIPLTSQLGYFYSHIILEETPTFGGDFFLQLFEVEKLDEALDGWKVIRANNTEDPNWSKDYIIFAERNGDVLFCYTSVSECPVYGSVQKRNFQIANSLSEFFTVFIEAIRIEEKTFNNETTDDDFNHKPEYLSAIEKKVSESLSQKFTQGFYYFFFG